MIAPKLKSGGEIRVAAPATTLAFIPEEQRETAKRRMRELGLGVSYSKNAEIRDRFESSPVEKRVADLHDAFSNPEASGILTILGGYNSNQLLPHLDYDLIGENPKVFCGFSDITALHNAIFAKTGLVTYYGPHFSTFAMERGIEYTMEGFRRCVMEDGPFEAAPADHWSDDEWYADQEERSFIPNGGYRIINEGHAEGRLLGGHLGTFCLLFGTTFMPDIRGSILLVECDFETKPEHFDRELQSLAMQPGFEDVRGLVIGRFQRASEMDGETLEEIIAAKPELDTVPIVADASFGHTTPQFTWPIGGSGSLRSMDGEARITIREH